MNAVLEQFLSERNYCEVTNVLLLIVRHWDDSILREMQPLLSRIAAIDMTSDGEEGGIRAAELLQRLNQLRQPLPTTGLVLSDDLTSALDYETMSSVVWLGWPEIEKYLPTLVLYCTNETYGRGAAHAFAPRLIGLGAKAMPTICSVLYRCLNSQKYSEIDCLLRMVVRHWDNPILQPIQPFLKTITSPDVLPVGDNVRAQVVTLLERSHRSVI